MLPLDHSFLSRLFSDRRFLCDLIDNLKGFIRFLIISHHILEACLSHRLLCRIVKFYLAHLLIKPRRLIALQTLIFYLSLSIVHNRIITKKTQAFLTRIGRLRSSTFIVRLRECQLTRSIICHKFRLINKSLL
jgi:hypothetical protein